MWRTDETVKPRLVCWQYKKIVNKICSKMLVCLWRSFCTKFCYFGVCASGARKLYVFTQRKIFRTIVTYYVNCKPLTGVRIGGWYTCRSLFVTLKRSVCMLQILWCSGISKNKCISIDLSFHVARTFKSSWFCLSTVYYMTVMCKVSVRISFMPLPTESLLHKR